METAWEKLIQRYADGKPICNCGQAYYEACSEGIDRNGQYRTDMLGCKHGCSSNQISAKEYIASKVIAETTPAA
jgi:hypothetical protein